jgi:hypothetical protein
VKREADAEEVGKWWGWGRVGRWGEGIFEWRGIGGRDRERGVTLLLLNEATGGPVTVLYLSSTALANRSVAPSSPSVTTGCV